MRETNWKSYMEERRNWVNSVLNSRILLFNLLGLD